MEKIKKDYYKSYRLPRVFIEDLEKIGEIIKEGGFEKYEVSTTDFKYENIAEFLKENKAKVKELKVELSSHNETFCRLKLYLSDEFVILDYPSNEKNLKSIGVDIDSVLNRTQRNFLSYLLNIAYYAWAVPFFLAILMPFKSIRQLLMFLLLALMFLNSTVLIFSKFKKSSTIKFIQREKGPGFLERNKDQIKMRFIECIISAVVGFILGYWVKF